MKYFLISTLVFVLMLLDAQSQTSQGYQQIIDSLESAKSNLTNQIKLIEKQIDTVMQLKSDTWINEQMGQVLVFHRDGEIYDFEYKSKEVKKVKKGTKVIFISDEGTYYFGVLYNGDRYIVKKRWVTPLSEIEEIERQKKIQDSLARVNAAPFVFSYEGKIYKSKTDWEPLFKVPKGTQVLLIKEIKGGAISNCLIKYKGDEYFTSKQDLIAFEAYQEKVNQAKKNQEEANRKYTVYKQTLTNKFGEGNAQRILDKEIWTGMTKEMLRSSWGQPNDIKTTETSSGISEQWVYDRSKSDYQLVYVDNGIVTSWQD